MAKMARIGVGGPVGSGKTALIEALVPQLMVRGLHPLVITNDLVTREDEEHVRQVLRGVLAPERIVGVETGTCPHTAVREDPSLNLAVIDEMASRFSDADVLLLESGGDNLTLTFSPALVDRSLFVLDVAGGDKVPRKKGPGVVHADLLVINKVDLAAYVGADLPRMVEEARTVRQGRPVVVTNCRTGEGVRDILTYLSAEFQWPQR